MPHKPGPLSELVILERWVPESTQLGRILGYAQALMDTQDQPADLAVAHAFEAVHGTSAAVVLRGLPTLSTGAPAVVPWSGGGETMIERRGEAVIIQRWPGLGVSPSLGAPEDEHPVPLAALKL